MDVQTTMKLIVSNEFMKTNKVSLKIKLVGHCSFFPTKMSSISSGLWAEVLNKIYSCLKADILQ